MIRVLKEPTPEELLWEKASASGPPPWEEDWGYFPLGASFVAAFVVGVVEGVAREPENAFVLESFLCSYLAAQVVLAFLEGLRKRGNGPRQPGWWRNAEVLGLFLAPLFLAGPAFILGWAFVNLGVAGTIALLARYALVGVIGGYGTVAIMLGLLAVVGGLAALLRWLRRH